MTLSTAIFQLSAGYNCIHKIMESSYQDSCTLTCHCTGIKSGEDENIIYHNWLLIPVAIEDTSDCGSQFTVVVHSV